MIFANAAMLEQRKLSPVTLNTIMTEIKKRRIEPTVESIGKGPEKRSSTLQELCLNSIVKNVSLSEGLRNLPSDLRLRLFAEISKQYEIMGDNAIELLANTPIKYVRITSRNITDAGLKRLGQVCPQLERAYLRISPKITPDNKLIPSITIEGLISVVEQCPRITWLDVSWTDVFNTASEDRVLHFFKCLSPSLKYFAMRSTGLRWMDLRINLLTQFTHLEEINLGKLPITHSHLTQILSACPIQRLVMDRLQLRDTDIQAIFNEYRPNLTLLDLGDTLCTDMGLEIIAEKCPNLEVLVLRNLPITNNEMRALSKNCKKIRSLYLGGCNELTDDAIIELANITALEEINLEGLYQLTEGSIRKLVASCKLKKNRNS